MTVQKLLDKLAHVAHKTKDIVVHLGSSEYEIHSYHDTHDKMILFLHETKEEGGQSGK